MIAPFRKRLREGSRAFFAVSGAVFLLMTLVLMNWKRPVREEAIMARKVEDGRVVRAELLVPVWLRKGWLAGTALAGLTFALSPWLARRRTESMRFREASGVPPLQKWEIAACVGLVVLGAWLAYPRLHHSLWGDEEYEASEFILGEVEPDESGKITYTDIPWSKTLWDMRKPTNHVGYTVLARLTHDAFFKRGDGPRDAWFSEELIRLPVFVAGLLLVPVMLWSLRVWGLRPWWALVFFALHPWVERFTSDARGYVFVMLGAAVMTGTLGRAVQTGRWRWWLAFGLAEFLALWCCLQSVYLVTGINLVALGCLLERDLRNDVRWLQAGRWVTANFLGAVLTIIMLAPCLPQLQRFMKTGEMMGDLDLTWWQDSFSSLLFGQLWLNWAGADHPFHTAMQSLIAQHPLPAVTGCVLLILIALAGLVALARRRERRPLLWFVAGSLVIMIVHNALTQRRPYDWYLCVFLPGLVFAIAASDEWLRRLPKVMRALVPVAALVLFAWITQKPRMLLRSHPSEAGRESVAIAREVTNPLHPDFGKGVVCFGHPIAMGCYDPALVRIGAADELRDEIRKAAAAGKAVWVNVNRMATWDGDFPAYSTMLRNEAWFDHVASFPGLMPYAGRDVFRYKGGF